MVGWKECYRTHVYANLFMAYLEERFLDECRLKPLMYSRYIDDIFFLWPHGKRSLTRFIDKVNSFHPTIKFTYECSTSSIHYLDIQVSLVNDPIQTSVFTKPTDRHTYIPFTSFHPDHTKKSIIYCQTLRYKRICSDNDDLNTKLNDLTKQFMLRGYPLKFIRKNMERANNVSRQELLKYKNVTPLERIPFTTNFHPAVRNLFQNFRSLWRILQSDAELEGVFKNAPLLSFRQPPNLRKILVSSKIPRSFIPPQETPCNKPRCQICQHVCTSSPIIPQAPHTNFIQVTLTAILLMLYMYSFAINALKVTM